MDATYRLLNQLGVTANYIGFFHAAHAVQLCIKQPERLMLVTKWVYPDVAKEYCTTWKAVERNIRTVGCIIWNENRFLLEQLAGRSLSHKPCAAQLLAILTYALLSPHRSDPLSAHGLNEVVALTGENDHVGMVDTPVDGDCGKAVNPEV